MFCSLNFCAIHYKLVRFVQFSMMVLYGTASSMEWCELLLGDSCASCANLDGSGCLLQTQTETREQELQQAARSAQSMQEELSAKSAEMESLQQAVADLKVHWPSLVPASLSIDLRAAWKPTWTRNLLAFLQ